MSNKSVNLKGYAANSDNLIVDPSRFETFAKYVLLEKLAMGGMAEVYLSRSIGHGGVGKFVAIKRILPQFSEQPEFVEMFKDEASIAINLQHANIVTINEFGMEKNQFFIAMDFVNGRNLKQILTKAKQANRGLEIEHIVYICKEVAAGLDHAHRCLNPATAKPLNIIHRDMSPHNVMLSFDGEIKVVDFGIAKAETQIESTRAGTLKGKFGYMSPEQADAQEVDQRTDVFSLGIILWELLANDRLFVGKNEIEILRKIKECNIQPLRKLNANIPAELEKIVAKALAKDRNLRYRNAEDLHRDLHRFLNLKYPDFSKGDFAKFLKDLFAKEIEETHRKLLEYAKTDFSSLMRPKKPATQGAPSRINPYSNLDNTPNSGVSTQKSITAHPNDAAAKLERQLERRLAPRPKKEEMAAPPPRLAEAAPTAPFEVREGGKENIIEAKNPEEIRGDAALKIDQPQKRGPNPYGAAGQYNSNYGGTGTPGVQQGTQANTRSRIENSSYNRQSPNTAGLVGLLIGVGALLGCGIWYFSNPERAGLVLSKFIGGRAEQASKGNPITAPEPLTIDKGPKVVVVPITSSPPGAEILINERSTGELTPTTLSLAEGEEVRLTLRLSGHHKFDELVRVQSGRVVTATMRADRKAFLDIAVMGAGEISIDGRVVAKSGPANGLVIPADQEVTVRVFDPVTKATDEVRVRVAENITRPITLIPRANIRGPKPASR